VSGPITFAGFDGKLALLERHVAGRYVLHLGAVGETCGDTELRVRQAGENSVHAFLTRASRACIGVDYDEPSVTALTERGVFDNLVCADVTKLTRQDVDLPSIDVIVAGDTIEHLSDPGMMLDAARALSDTGSRLLLTTPNALGAAIFVRNLLGRQLEGPDHVCSFNAYSLRNLLERHGWRLDELWTAYQPRAAEFNPRAFRLGRAVYSRFPKLGGTLFATCSLA
jgi:hypothetical protein